VVDVVVTALEVVDSTTEVVEDSSTVLVVEGS
jgi:hypothetical protein